MANKTIRLFSKRLKVIGSAKPIRFADGFYRFWEIKTKEGETCLIFREMCGIVTLQERLYYFLQEEAQLVPTAAIGLVFAEHIAPASVDAIKKWALSHPRQMKKFDLYKEINRD